MKHHFFIILLLFSLTACEQEEQTADAYGNFESDYTTVGAEAGGRLLYLTVEEGQQLPTGRLVGLVDTTQLHLQKLQIQATIAALGRKTRSPLPEIEVLRARQRSLERERERFAALLADKAATPKQLDDIIAELEVVEKQIEAARRQVSDTNRGILSEADPLYAQLAVLEEQIRKCYIYNPMAGTVLTKTAMANEVVGFGTPLYRIAPLDTLMLRAYIDGSQLSGLQLGQSVTVLTGTPETEQDTLSGRVDWIAAQAEFTPKTIQTRAERANLVYATKIAVPNPAGRLKIGMPAEVYFITPKMAAQ